MPKMSMGLLDQWEDKRELQSFLGEQLLQGRLALVLGAGISLAFGLPSWDELIRRLFEEQNDSPPSGLRLEQQAENFLLRFYKNDNAGYLRAVQRALYRDQKLSFAQLRRHSGLAAIGALVMSSSRGSASTVLTFNFDDVLELYLEYHGFVTLSVSEEMHWLDKVDVTILHPHGLLPSPLSPQREMSSKITLDQRSFSMIVGKDAERIRQELLTIARTHTCVFIGLSGNDANLDSILLDVQSSHAARAEGHLYWGIKFTDRDDEAERLSWGSRGIFCVKVDYQRGMPEFLFKVCQIAAERRRI